MISTVVLVRHGKAQARSEELPDSERELTKPGQRALRAWFPTSFSLLDTASASDVRIWTSPAVRARQTAQEVQRVLGVEGIEDHDSLLWQDEDAFMAELEASSADIVVAVGHNPFMDEFAGRLCGDEMPFATGGVAAFNMNDADAETPARLLWFVQGPQVANWKTVCALERALKLREETMEQRLADLFEQPDDPETTHKFRVSIRTLRSLIAFSAPFIKKSQVKQAMGDLQSILAVTSDLRDIDVLSDQVRQMEPPAAELDTACIAMRDARRNELVDTLRGGKAQKAIARVRKAMQHVKWKSSIEQGGLVPESIGERYAALVEAMEAELAGTNLADARASHKLRKHAKRLRYVSENLDDLLDADTAQMAQTMTGLQDTLGELCDARANLSIIQRFPTKNLPDQAKWDLTLLKARNEAYVCTVLKQKAH